MSNLRERAAEVKERGIEERDNWTPPDLATNVYNYWLANTKSTKGREIRNGERKENFCHFWRVVAIWSPLRAIWNTAEIWGGILAIGLLLFGVGAFIWMLATSPNFWKEALLGAAIIASIAAGLAGVFGGIGLALNEEEREAGDLQGFKASVIMSIIGLPTALVTFTATWAVKLYLRYLTDYNKQIGLGVLGVAVAGFLSTMVMAGGWTSLLWALGSMLAGALVLTGIIALAVFVSDFVRGRRALAAEKREKFYEEWGKYPEQVEQEKRDAQPPSKFDLWLSAFGKGLGDLAIFIAQVVRVKKWGICPLVEIADASTIDSKETV